MSTPTNVVDAVQEESDRQAILLALATLSIERPGWHYMLGLIADRFQGRVMYETFRDIGRSPGAAPRTEPSPEPRSEVRSPYLQCPVERCSVEFMGMDDVVQHVDAAHVEFLAKLTNKRQASKTSSLREVMRSDVMTELETWIGHAVTHLDYAANRVKSVGSVSEILSHLSEARSRMLRINSIILALRGRATVIAIPRQHAPDAPKAAPQGSEVAPDPFAESAPQPEKGVSREVVPGITITPM